MSSVFIILHSNGDPGRVGNVATPLTLRVHEMLRHSKVFVTCTLQIWTVISIVSIVLVSLSTRCALEDASWGFGKLRRRAAENLPGNLPLVNFDIKVVGRVLSAKFQSTRFASQVADDVRPRDASYDLREALDVDLVIDGSQREILVYTTC